MDGTQDNRYRQLVLAARRSLSLAELYSALTDGHGSAMDIMEATLAQVSQGELEVSGGIRPIVHFKRMTELIASPAAHTTAATTCLQTFKHAKDNWPNYGNSRQQVLHSSKLPFLKYAIEHLFAHTDRADDNAKQVFCQDFEYQEWQAWAIHLPVYAAINTYRFGGALTRCKCSNLLRYVMQNDRSKLHEGSWASGCHDRFLEPLSWRGNYSITERRTRCDERWTSRAAATREIASLYGGYSRSGRSLADDAWDAHTAQDAEPSVTAPSQDPAGPQTPRAASPAQSTFSFEHLSLATPAASEADTASLWSFEDMSEPMDDDEPSWEEIEFQTAILESLQHGNSAVAGSSASVSR